MLGMAGASVAMLGRLRAAEESNARGPDLIVWNANVLTVDSGQPRAEAFAVRAGRFIAVGRNDEIRALSGPNTQSYDAQRATVVPGFIDCHNHAVGNVLLYEVLVGNPFEVEFVTIESIVGKLAAKARQTPPGYWI